VLNHKGLMVIDSMARMLRRVLVQGDADALVQNNPWLSEQNTHMAS
jgi:hypothetical protein